MARIVLDSNALTSLAGVYREQAQALGAVAATIGREADRRDLRRILGPSSTPDDVEVQNRLRTARAVAAQVRDDALGAAHDFDVIAGRVDEDQRRGWAPALPALALVAPAGWRPWSFGRGEAPPDGAWASPADFRRPGPVQAVLEDMGRLAVHGAESASRAGLSVGRSVVGGARRGIGLLGQAAVGVGRTADSLGEKILHLLQQAWKAIWDTVQRAFAEVVKGINEVVRVCAEVFKGVLDTLTHVGKWVVDSALWFVGEMFDLGRVLLRALFDWARGVLADGAVWALGHFNQVVGVFLGLHLGLAGLFIDYSGGLIVGVGSTSRFVDWLSVQLGGRRNQSQPPSRHGEAQNRTRPSTPMAGNAWDIDGYPPDGFTIERVADGPPQRYVIKIRGLDVTQVRDWDTALRFAGPDSEMVRNIRRAIAEQVPDGAQILIIGHSLGGMAAATLASDPRVTDIITLGSPVDVQPLNRPGLHVLAIERDGDLVPRVDGREASATGGDIRKVHFGNNDGSLDPIGSRHRIGGNYEAAVSELEKPGSAGNIRFGSTSEVSRARDFLSRVNREFPPTGRPVAVQQW